MFAVKATRGTRLITMFQVDEEECDAARPISSELCQPDSCDRWSVGPWSECSSRCGLGLEERMVRCVDMRGEEGNNCQERRPGSRRHCKGSCIDDYSTDYGWTRVIDGQQHSVYIDNEGQMRVHVTNISHKAEFLETAEATNNYLNTYLFLIFYPLYNVL